jgi:hypothetical protein
VRASSAARDDKHIARRGAQQATPLSGDTAHVVVANI